MSDWMDALSPEKQEEIEREARAYEIVRATLDEAADVLVDQAHVLYPGNHRVFDQYVHALYELLMDKAGIVPTVPMAPEGYEPKTAARRAEDTALYRAWSPNGALLYIGITKSPTSRMRGHERTAEWWDEMQSVTFTWLPTREAALEAEAIAIVAERPPFNVALHPEEVR